MSYAIPGTKVNTPQKVSENSMDHLTHIREPSTAPLQVHYLGTAEMQYDNRGFTGFPSRCGIDVQRLLDTHFEELNLDEIAPFLQAWVFFGFIHEFFQCADVVFRKEDFIYEDANSNSIITTKNLPNLVWNWIASEMHRPPEGRLKRVEIYTLLFSLAQKVLLCLTRIDRVRYNIGKFDKLGSSVLLSAVIISETLSRAFERLFQALNKHAIIEKIAIDQHGWDTPSAAFARLESSGWCRGEMSYLENEMLSTSSMYLLGSVARSRLNRDHTSCTDARCVADQVVKGTYKSKHHLPGCVCDFSPGPHDGTIERICQILDSGNLPLILVSGKTNNLNVKVEAYNLSSASSDSVNPSYVAISHVWADGKGNPNQNSLPQCVLLRLQCQVNALYPQRSSATWFWIDTLCIPLERRVRKIGIARLLETYSKADKVLVIDKGLELLSEASSPEERLLAIRTCGWMQRLWTLQEGWLAGQLYFQFVDVASDGPGLLRDCMENSEAPMKLNIKSFARTVGQNPALRESIIRALVHDARTLHIDPEKKVILDTHYKKLYPELPTVHDTQLSSLLNNCQILDLVVHDGAQTLIKLRTAREKEDRSGEVFTALKGRTTSHLDDEPICVANLLGIDSRPIIFAESDQRMKLLLRTMRNLPISIIFSHGERMREPGYRWAPTSFLIPDSTTYLASRNAYFESGQLTFVSPGIDLQMRPTLPHEWECQIIIDGQQYSLYLLESSGTSKCWDHYQHVPMMIILRNPMRDGGPADGALVSRQKALDGVFWVLYERTVWIQRHGSKRDVKAVQGEGTWIPSDQKWCITDTPKRTTETASGVRHILASKL